MMPFVITGDINDKQVNRNSWINDVSTTLSLKKMTNDPIKFTENLSSMYIRLYYPSNNDFIRGLGGRVPTPLTSQNMGCQV